MRWHPKVALRYLPIVKEIKRLKLNNSNMLEIGSGSLGITPYLNRKVTGIDLDFFGPQTDLLTKVRASAINIPFDNRSFDVVLMVDVIEHLPENDRKKALEEGFRIAKKLLVISVPEGKDAFLEDKIISDYYYHIYKKEFPFLQEHRKYKLPENKFVNDTIKELSVKYKRKVDIIKTGNVNMRLHRFLMKGWITKSLLIDIIFRKVFLLLIPVFTRLNWEPTYRKIYFIRYK